MKLFLFLAICLFSCFSQSRLNSQSNSSLQMGLNSNLNIEYKRTISQKSELKSNLQSNEMYKSSLGLNNAGQSRCSTKDINPVDRLIVETQLNHLRAHRKMEKQNKKNHPSLEIPIYVHIIAKDQTQEGGNVPDAAIDEQIQVLNQSFASMNIKFYGAGIDRTIDKKWFTFDVGEELIKKSLHRGDAQTLNLYISGGENGTLGWATFPWDYSSEPDMDGVVIHFETLPQGGFKQYNMGATAVHEVGHWLGLYHVFQGGCADGDEVADTPAQSHAQYGCPEVAPDTCSSEGVDSIHNFMDYSDDICLTTFSAGQIERIHDTFASYRK